jgi:hypothetical protein
MSRTLINLAMTAILLAKANTAVAQTTYAGDNEVSTGSRVQQPAVAKQPAVQAPATSIDQNTVHTTIYSNNYSTIQLAITAACNGTVPGSVVLPAGTVIIASTITIPSNCNLSGQGSGQSLLQAAKTFFSPMITFSSASHVRLANFAVDGNRSANSHVFDGIDIFGSDIVLDGMTVANFRNNGVLVFANSSHVTIQNSEIFNNGPTSPAIQGPSGIIVAGGAASEVSVLKNSIHDNSTGVQVVNSVTPGQDVSGVLIANNRIYSNANDAILITTTSLTGGNIVGVRVENNRIYCNGWPANGVAFSPRCVPGIMQSGALASQGGVGVDLIQQGSASLVRPLITGNVIHDNAFEGVSPTTNICPIVNTSRRTVTWVSGPTFNKSWHAGQNITILGRPYTIASVTSTTSLQTTKTLPTQTGVGSNFPGYMGAVISNNDVSLSGQGVVGPCFYNQFSDGNKYFNNVATKCNLSGFENFYSSFLTYTGDKAYSNNLARSPGHNAGFTNFGGYATTYSAITTDDVVANPTQSIGVKLDSVSSNTVIHSQSIHARTPISDKARR